MTHNTADGSESMALTTVLALPTPELEDHVKSCSQELCKRTKQLQEESESVQKDIDTHRDYKESVKKQYREAQQLLSDMVSMQPPPSDEDLEEARSDVTLLQESVKESIRKWDELLAKQNAGPGLEFRSRSSVQESRIE